jgi:hypothetical protein
VGDGVVVVVVVVVGVTATCSTNFNFSKKDNSFQNSQNPNPWGGGGGEGGTSLQAKCPILAYSNLLLGRIHILSETSNRRALCFASTNQIAPFRYVHFKYCWPFLVACAMVFCLEKKGVRFQAQQSVSINICYK